MNYIFSLVTVACAITTCLAADLTCYQCASPGLRNNWMATGLPLMPAESATESTVAKEGFFTASCASPTEKNLIKTCPACLSLILPTGANGEKEFVRGCHSDFLPAGVAPYTTDSCFVFRDTVTGEFAVSDICISPNNDAPCNTYGESHVSQVKCTTGTGAALKPNYICKKCIDHNEAGECLGDRVRANATGSTCTAYYGTLDGEKYVELGASWAIQSLTEVDKCFTLPKAYTAGYKSEAAMSYGEPNYFAGDLCFCNTANCNADNKTQPITNTVPLGRLPILFSLVPALFVLPLLSLQ